MFQQQCTHEYLARFHTTELIREHDTLSLRAPGQMFQALQVPEKIDQIDLVALQKISHLVASTLDLELCASTRMLANRNGNTWMH